jgi:hypothetical protein
MVPALMANHTQQKPLWFRKSLPRLQLARWGDERLLLAL